jgi:two-component system NarL family response regulator
MTSDLKFTLDRIGAAARAASRVLGRADKAQRAAALQAMAKALRDTERHILAANERDVEAAIKAGAMGYLLKGSSPRDLIEALRNLHSGGAPMSAKIARKVILELQGQVAVPALEPLSQRESAVLNGIALSKSYKELAVELGVSPHTIHAYVKRVYEKLQARNRSEILQKARVLGLI